MQKPKDLRKEITSDKAVELYKKIKAEITKERAFTDTDNHILNDLCMLEQIKEQHIEDIKKRGVIVEWRNSDTSFGHKDNPSVDKVMKIVEQQRKLLSEMKITASSKKGIVQSLETGSDSFEKF